MSKSREIPKNIPMVVMTAYPESAVAGGAAIRAPVSGFRDSAVRITRASRRGCRW